MESYNVTFTNSELVRVIKTERNLRNAIAVSVLFSIFFSGLGPLNIVRLALFAWWSIAVYKSAKAQKKNANFYLVIQILPFIVGLLVALFKIERSIALIALIGSGIIALALTISLIYSASGILKKNGVKAGFWGVKKAELERLTSTST